MLVKTSLKAYDDDLGWFHEDMGIDRGTHIDFMLWGRKEKTAQLAQSLSPVMALHLLWIHRGANVRCNTAVTLQEKIAGLQSYDYLAEDEGLFFPYPGGAKVCFHQGSVSYPLDIIFIRKGEIVDCATNTRVGSRTRWSCDDCDAVLEVNGGWMERHEAAVGDKLAWFANSERDIAEYEQDVRMIAEEARGAALFGELAYRLFE
jgi:uncharacterized membrane protein (UPF0127 family)